MSEQEHVVSMSTMDSRILAKITLSGMLSEPPFFTVYNWVALRRHNLSAGSPPKIVMIRACLYGRGACAGFTLKSAALIKTKPTEW